MPLGWISLPKLPSQAPARPQGQSQTVANPVEIGTEGELHFIGAPTISMVPYRKLLLKGGQVTYGETVLKADEIELYPDGTDELPAGTGFARGHVQVTDPVGLLSADNASFNWIKRTGTANFATVTFEGVEITAAKATISPTVWQLDGVVAGLAHGKPVLAAKAGHAVIRPGVGLTFYSISASAFGRRLFGLHHLDYQQEGHFSGDHYPVPTFSGDRGFGVRYRPLYLIDDRTAVGASVVANQTSYPSYGATLSRSFLPNGEAKGLVVPRYDLDMRFDYGYFDSVGVSSPTAEHALVEKERDNVSLDTQFNVQAFDRKGEEVFDKPFEATVERSLPLPHGFGLLTDDTLQQIRSLGGSDHDRFLDATSLSFPMIRLAPTLTSRIRVDGASFLGGGETFSWLHSEFGLIYRPNQNLRLGAAYVAGKQFGTPLYQVDELYSVNGVDFRMDYQFGPHGISLLGKYDTDRGAWFDREILVSQIMGPFEGFVRFRTFPSQLIFGAQLRVDSVFTQLLNRHPGRPTEPAKLQD